MVKQSGQGEESTVMSLSRALICGLGSIGRRHLRVLAKYWPGFNIAVLRSGYGPPCEELNLANHVFSSIDEAMLWQPDFAVVSTPATDHLSKALVLARQGIPLLIEKPVGAGTEEPSNWKELLDLSAKVPVAVAYVLRHDPCTSFVRDQLAKGLLGKLVEADFYCGSWLPDWRLGLDYRDCVSARRDMGGGALLELSHEIDLAQWLFGPIQLDYARLEQSGLLEIDVEDQVVLLARSADRFPLTIRLNFCTNPPRRHLTVRGSDGELRWNLIDGNVKVVRAQLVDPQVYTSSIAPDCLFRMQMKHFLSCARKLEPPMCSLSDGIETLRLVAKARAMSELI